MSTTEPKEGLTNDRHRQKEARAVKAVEALAEQYAARLRDAGFLVEEYTCRPGDDEMRGWQSQLARYSAVPRVSASLRAFREEVSVHAGWSVPVTGGRTRFDGVRCGERNGKRGLADLEALIACEDISRWYLIKGFYRGPRDDEAAAVAELRRDITEFESPS